MKCTMPTARGALAAALAAACLAACSRGTETWNGLLITIDTTRKDAPSFYGTTSGVTPSLDALARESLVYENARTSVPLTLPAHASIMTGLYPPRHTVRVNGTRPLPGAARTLAEAAEEAGLQTGAFLGAVVLAREFGLDQGFATYDVPERGNLATSFYDERPAAEVVDGALAWLKARDASRPFLLWMHLFDSHEPYEPSAAFRRGAERSQLYLGELGYADSQLGRLFDALRRDGTLDRTFVAVVADHGEGLGEHGEASHGDLCNDATLRIPFLLRYPDGYRAGERSKELVSVVDVAPTLAEAMRLSMPASIDGRSLFRRSVAPDRGVYFETYSPWVAYDWSPITGWVNAQGKYVHSSHARFFDVRRDPGEDRNVIAEVDVGSHRAALAQLADLPTLAEAEVQPIDEELRARIQGLGYAGVDAGQRVAPGLLSDTGRADPMDNVELQGELMQAYSLLSAGRYAEASAGFEDALAADPLNPFALDHLGTSLIREGRFAAAVPVLQKLIALGRRRAGTFFNLGVSLDRLDRREEARTAFLEARKLAPDEPRIRRYLEELENP